MDKRGEMDKEEKLTLTCILQSLLVLWKEREMGGEPREKKGRGWTLSLSFFNLLLLLFIYLF